MDATEQMGVSVITQPTCYTRNPLANGILKLGGPGGKESQCAVNVDLSTAKDPAGPDNRIYYSSKTTSW